MHVITIVIDSVRILMLDNICLPGCEGGPVFDEDGYLIGVCLIMTTLYGKLI